MDRKRLMDRANRRNIIKNIHKQTNKKSRIRIRARKRLFAEFVKIATAGTSKDKIQ